MQANSLPQDIAACRLCKDRFAATATAHKPRPVVWFQPGARVLIAGQAPGARVHASGKPFDDPSGERLRAWLGIGPDVFYDTTRIAIVPMAFCFPGYDAKGSDLPPPPLCARTWSGRVADVLGNVGLRILVGGYAHRHYLGTRNVTETVADWQAHAPRTFPLPHPSWRNTGWLKRNPWFDAQVLPALQARLKEVLQ